jgi:membrane fusion protein, heavy metal efflux system
MERSLNGLRSTARSRLTTGCVFVALAAIGFWGHVTHWDFASLPGGGNRLATTATRHYALKHPTTATADRVQIPDGQIRLASPEVVEQMGIQLVAAESRPMYRELSVTARVAYEPSRIAQLSARVPGTVWRVEKHVGQSIHRGEVLAIVDSMQVGKAKTDLLHTLADVSLKQRLADRLNRLDAGLVPKKQIDLAEVELRKARFELFNNEQTLINLGLPIDPEKLHGMSDEDLLRYVKFLGLPQPIVDSLDPKTATANLLPIVAPFDGLVVGQDIARGELVATDENRFEIADVSHMMLRLGVREEDGEELRLGQQVVFTTAGARVTTSISWISTAIDPKTRMIEVRCDTVNPQLCDDQGQPTGQYLLRANMFGTAQVRVEERSGAIVVPTKAVQTSGNKHYVFVETDASGFEARRVDVGIATDEVTELIHGLSLGERVASEGSHVLKSEAIRRQNDEGA